MLFQVCGRCTGTGMTSDEESVVAHLDALGVPPDRRHIHLMTGQPRTEPMRVHCPHCGGRKFIPFQRPGRTS